jgi:GNAT superfamily N-acetyltransferase
MIMNMPHLFCSNGAYFFTCASKSSLMKEDIQLLDYSTELQPYFEKISKEWVEHYFALEPWDIEQLKDPDAHIINKGGVILFAKSGGEIVGTVGLMPVSSGVFELVKMGVTASARGQRVGQLLAAGILDKARSIGASKIILYTNSKLGAALHIYRKLGFRALLPEAGKYQRCDIKMELDL